MGIYDHLLFPKPAVPMNLPVPSTNFANLFYEFLRRYYEWKSAKLREIIGMLLLMIIGVCIVSIPWLLPNFGILFSLCLLVLFYLAVRYFLAVSQRVSHLYVNVHVLQHHLVGKLEVGFCEHREPCHCAEEFIDYVLRNYNISLTKILI
ncbi:hypothetical protein Desaci_3182 [Desulfosporosinus acidiphilus SJ4]|uniref:Uncharacterized protein n=1 Tax=Desulfosporosinus acidiphilus (strain DSM 22704 / JCM 16185 / SJ4) TaxID=646529 RepID=I4D8G2_DESAJ|nr:hypothetical protein [Desulfosporosinus acidiphilus]AFM42086.1 hypothetical protein Desaci_3182 [Desulfosporosinus acidiphilus SJ4]